VELRQPGSYHRKISSVDDNHGRSASSIPLPRGMNDTPNPPPTGMPPPRPPSMAPPRPPPSWMPPPRPPPTGMPQPRPPPMAPPVPPLIPPLRYQPDHRFNVPRQAELELEREGKQVSKELLEKFGELRDKASKKTNAAPAVGPESSQRRGSDLRSDSGIVRSLMRQVEKKSHERMALEQEHIEKVKLDVVMGRPTRRTRSFQMPPLTDPIEVQISDHRPPPPPPQPGMLWVHPERENERRRGGSHAVRSVRNSHERDQDVEMEIRPRRKKRHAPATMVWRSGLRTS
jgi:hypothetical protein